MAELWDQVPVELRERLLALRPRLCKSGSLLRRKEKGRQGTYRLRVRVTDSQRGRRQLAIKVGDDSVAAVVNDVLKQWRRERDETLAAECAAREAHEREARELRELRKHAQQLAGGGQRRRRAVGLRFDEAVQAGGVDEYVFWVGNDYLRPNRRPGRHRKYGLTLGG